MTNYHNQFSIVEDYINDKMNRCPLIITGSSGAGKSSLMAFTAKKVK